jgi:hypothetical protein
MDQSPRHDSKRSCSANHEKCDCRAHREGSSTKRDDPPWRRRDTHFVFKGKRDPRNFIRKKNTKSKPAKLHETQVNYLIESPVELLERM